MPRRRGWGSGQRSRHQGAQRVWAHERRDVARGDGVGLRRQGRWRRMGGAVGSCVSMRHDSVPARAALARRAVSTVGRPMTAA